MWQYTSVSSSGGKGLAHTERTGADFFAQPVFSANAEVESMRRGIGHWMLVRSGGAGVSDGSDERRLEDRRSGINNGE